MRIIEALKILHGAGKTSKPFPVTLACGFTPLHLSTFLAAHLQQQLPGRRVEVSTGLYGDLAGTLESLSQTSSNAIAIVIEWADLDPRLGFRSAGAWGAAAINDILSALPRVLRRIKAALETIPRAVSVAVCMPTLPLPPLFHTPGWQASNAELALDEILATFASNLQTLSTVRVVNPRRLAEESAPAHRFDFKSDLLTGLPYTLTHADALASALTQLLLPAPPKKGLITDLDDTLWSGLVGEIGPDKVNWDLTSHAAYQKLLASFAQEGVLLAVASKNDSAVVQQAFQREDILIPASCLYPMELHWDAKSGSVARILQSWNISADSVVFVDDSPLELAEVSAAHPGIECIQFAGYEMLRRLRDLFGKGTLSEEDSLRSASIRRASEFNAASQSGSSSEDFLKNLNAVVSFDFPEEFDARSLDLVNKTNQFNLNGTRYTEAEWAKKLLLNNSVCVAVTYEDKFGPLGKISVLQGQQKGRTLRVDVWVLSCRAFARRIEHQCLRLLFDRYAVDTIEFSFERTAKNGPLSGFLNSLSAADGLLTREHFQQHCPPLYHNLKEAKRVEVNG